MAAESLQISTQQVQKNSVHISSQSKSSHISSDSITREGLNNSSKKVQDETKKDKSDLLNTAQIL